MKHAIDYFKAMTDPRVDRTKEHLLEDIIFTTIAAVICGAETWNDIEHYGQSKKEWLRRYLHLPGGIPSHDTFNRVFSALNPEEFEHCFVEWVKDVARLSEGEVVSIDGKIVRGSWGGDGHSAIHLVSAWAGANQLVLGQVKTEEKSNEITAIPRLLEELELKGYLVTIDAMGCQPAIAEQIIAQDADYLLAVKGNQPQLERDIADTLRFHPPASE